MSIVKISAECQNNVFRNNLKPNDSNKNYKMMTISNIWKNVPANTYLVLQARYKSKTHWVRILQ